MQGKSDLPWSDQLIIGQSGFSDDARMVTSSENTIDEKSVMPDRRGARATGWFLGPNDYPNQSSWLERLDSSP